MKKTTALLISFVLLFSFAGCNGNENSSDSTVYEPYTGEVKAMHAVSDGDTGSFTQYSIDVGNGLVMKFTETLETERIGIEDWSEIEKGDTVTIEWEYEPDKPGRKIVSITLVAKNPNPESTTYGTSTGEIKQIYGLDRPWRYSVDTGYGLMIEFEETLKTEYIGMEDSSELEPGDIVTIEWEYEPTAYYHTVVSITLVTENS